MNKAITSNKLEFFTFPQENLKVTMVTKDDNLLEEIRNSSSEKECLPNASKFYTDLYFPKAREDRPYTFSSICLSSDGKMAYLDNPSGPLVGKNNFLNPDASLADFWICNVLRSYADGVIIGARTLQSEPGVTCHVYDEELTVQRVKYLNKKYQPCGVVVSFDATDIPFDHYIFNVDESYEYKMVIATSPSGLGYIKENSPLNHIVIGPFNSKEEVEKYNFGELYKDFDIVPVIVTGSDDRPDSDLLLYALRKLGIERLSVESPSYTTHMLHNKTLDEYFINYSMVFVGGNMTPGYSAPFTHTEHPHSEVLSLGIHGPNFLYTRQRLRYDVNSNVDLTGYKY